MVYENVQNIFAKNPWDTEKSVAWAILKQKYIFQMDLSDWLGTSKQTQDVEPTLV